MYSSLLSFVTLMFLPLGIKSRSVIWKTKQKQQHGNQIIRFKQQKGHNNHRNDGGTAIHYCWYQFIKNILRENKKDSLYESLTMNTAIQSLQDNPTYDDAHSHTHAWWTVNHWSAVNNKRKMKINCLPPPPPPTILKKNEEVKTWLTHTSPKWSSSTEKWSSRSEGSFSLIHTMELKYSESCTHTHGICHDGWHNELPMS